MPRAKLSALQQDTLCKVIQAGSRGAYEFTLSRASVQSLVRRDLVVYVRRPAWTGGGHLAAYVPTEKGRALWKEMADAQADRAPAAGARTPR